MLARRIDAVPCEENKGLNIKLDYYKCGYQGANMVIRQT